jgi:hypothetical protein
MGHADGCVAEGVEIDERERLGSPWRMRDRLTALAWLATKATAIGSNLMGRSNLGMRLR